MKDEARRPRWKRLGSLGLSLLANLCAGPAAAQPTLEDPNLQVETVVSGLSVPTSMAFLGPGDILVLEKQAGRVRRVLNGVLQPTPVLDVAVNNASERGMLGIAINTEAPPKVFLYYTEIADPDGDGLPDDSSTTPIGNNVYRYTWNAAQGQLEDRTPVLLLPVLSGPNHDGGVIFLGPTPTPGGPALPGDGSPLYAIIGDLNRNGQLQNYPDGNEPDDSGVILRVLQDGTAAPGNPFVPYCSQTTTQLCPTGSGCPGGETCITEVARYYAYGVRNSFGMALDPNTGRLWDTENGPSLFDEINAVEPGFNSGWERIMGPDSNDPQGTGDLFDIPNEGSTYSDPEFSWASPVAVTAILFPVGSILGPTYDSRALVGDNNNGNLYAFPLNAARDGFVLGGGLSDLVANSIAERELVRIGQGFSSITDLELGPDGAVYVVSLGHGSIYRLFSTTPTRTPTISPTATVSPSPSITSTPLPTDTPDPAGSPTPSVTRTSTVTPASSSTPSASSTASVSSTVPATATATATASGTGTAFPGASATASATATASSPPDPSGSPTPSSTAAGTPALGGPGLAPVAVLGLLLLPLLRVRRGRASRGRRA